MTQTLLTVAAFVLMLAMVPMGIRWVQGRSGSAGTSVGTGSKVISAVAVGPHQRVVTVEVGPVHARVCLVLGVTGQSIACLHTMPASAVAGHQDVALLHGALVMPSHPS